MFACCECCVLSGRGLCDGLITRPEESYRLWRVVVCDQETSRMRRLKPATGLWKIQRQGCNAKKANNKQLSCYSQPRIGSVKCSGVICRFCREVDDICALLGSYAAYGGNFLPTFRHNLSVPSSRVKNPRIILGFYSLLNLGARYGWMFNATPRPLFPPGKKSGTLCVRRWGAQGRSGRIRQISPPTGIRSPDRPAP